MPTKKNIEKDSRAYTLTHEGFLLIQALAKKLGISPSAYLELIAREDAEHRLTEVERQAIHTEAERITVARRSAIRPE